MNNTRIGQALSVAMMWFSLAGITLATESGLGLEPIDWPAFMRSHDMTFDTLPRNWKEAPHFGNALIGSMLYQVDNTIRLQVFRADVQDHRDDTYGWPAYSRPHLQIGHFSLNPVGKLTGCTWRKDLWNAELTGTITTDRGEIRIRHFTHAEDMAIVTELIPSAGEQACRWTWHPIEATSSRSGYPTEASQIPAFAEKYGQHYADTLKVFKPNPAGRQEQKGNAAVWVQDLLAGGQYATAWTEQVQKDTRTLMVTIANSYPETTAAMTAVSDVTRFLTLDRSTWTKIHRDWWHTYYTKSYVTIPDKSLESLYWQTIYRFGCTSRTGRFYVDCPGIWFQGGGWAYTTTNWNIQCAHWSVYAANRLEQGQALLDRFYDKREELIKAVRPVEWQTDSAYLPHEVAGDLIGNREQDMRYYDEVGTLPWTLNNFWTQYRYSMDDEMLREKIYPLLRRSMNLYFHMVETDDDGTLHLPPTYSPETGVHQDCNFDLALFKWGCYTLLKASKRLGIDDPLIPQWKNVVNHLVDFPADEYGFRLGSDHSSSPSHRHFSNLLVIYPLYLVNIEQEGAMEILQASYDRAHSINGLPAMVQSHAGPIGAALGQGDTVLEGLKRLQGDLFPNGMWFNTPCLESSLGMANIVQNMLIQSWTDPAADESGPIRIFPAVPSAWKDVEFRDLRAEGAFLVSAKRTDGHTQWVRIKSLAGEPCRVRPGLEGDVRIESEREHTLTQVSPGIYDIDMKQGDEVVLYAADETTLSLAGTWRFQLDPDNVGVEQAWFAQALADTVTLPGTTDENHKGVFKDERAVDRLSRVWYWKGPAWYQTQVTIPEAWTGKRISLYFERTKHTRVWIDESFCGWEDTLSAPQVFDVTGAMTPGEHTMTVLVDNAKLPPVGPAHAVDERTQTNWNGILGRMELRATAPVWLADVQVTPDVDKKQATVRAVIGNVTGQAASGQITVACESYNVTQPTTFETLSIDVNLPESENVIEFTYVPGDAVPLWDEFQPAMLRLRLDLETGVGDQAFRDRSSVNFGMRSFTRDRNRLLINGKSVFLRGRTDSCNYPLTGYAPMDKAEWLRLLAIHKAWGINHVRFHSWCPPEAAFEAADELGMYFQAEIPNKRSAFQAPENEEAAIFNIDRLDVESTDTQTSLYEYAKREGELIFKRFGNHPSFVMFTLGNELGRTKGMFDLVAHFRQTDPRHLYAQGSNNMHWNPSLADGDDFWVTGKVAKDALPLRGSFSVLDFSEPPLETFAFGTMVDFGESIQGVPVPLIGHETGQYQVSPDYRDIPKFTGVTRARNYEIFRDRLKAAGMLDQAHDFVMASGALSALCYREDIEMALRTPGLGGIQLLDIQDFPGQGTALVGMLNDFMESKSVIEPQAWRHFCCETVPLLRMKKYTWTTAETFVGRVQIAHYGPSDMNDAQVTWTVTDSQGRQIAGDAFDPVTIPQGSVFEVDMFAMPLEKVFVPQKLTVTLAIEGTPYCNEYPIWVYAQNVGTRTPRGVMLTRNFQAEETQKHLANGGKVVLLPKLGSLPLSVPGGFQTEFWSPMFAINAEKRGVTPPPGTLGFLCDPQAPALAKFPTEFHSNWQWWHLVKNSRPIQFDDTPDDYRPTVQVIDNFVRNSKLGLIAETKVGKGKLLICAIDLLGHQDKPEARQLLHSLLQYAASRKFAPASEIEGELLNKLFPE